MWFQMALSLSVTTGSLRTPSGPHLAPRKVMYLMDRFLRIDFPIDGGNFLKEELYRCSKFGWIFVS